MHVLVESEMGTAFIGVGRGVGDVMREESGIGGLGNDWAKLCVIANNDQNPNKSNSSKCVNYAIEFFGPHHRYFVNDQKGRN